MKSSLTHQASDAWIFSWPIFKFVLYAPQWNGGPYDLEGSIFLYSAHPPYFFYSHWKTPVHYVAQFSILDNFCGSFHGTNNSLLKIKITYFIHLEVPEKQASTAVITLHCGASVFEMPTSIQFK